MNFGQNLYNWFLSNAQSLVLLAIVVIGLYLGFKREFSKLIGFLIIAIIAVGLVFNAAGVKDILLELLDNHAWQSDNETSSNVAEALESVNELETNLDQSKESMYKLSYVVKGIR